MKPRRHDFGSMSLSLLSALDTTDGVDETLALSEPVERDGITMVERRSTLWERAWLELHRDGDRLEVHTCVAGRGALTEVRLLGGRSALAHGAPLGRMYSGTRAQTLFSPNPEDGAAPFRPVGEGAVTGVVGEGEPGRARWLFTPAPLYWCFEDVDLAIVSPVDELRFGEAAIEASAKGFCVRMDYDGRTHVDGEFRAPVLVLHENVADPWTGLRRVGAPPQERDRPAWWDEPIFCGWGAQCYLENGSGKLARDFATQANYDAFLTNLEAHGVVPGTVVLDDKWQATYGRNEPDTAKWPDLKGWIAERHARGQHVLLWWKAWDPEGLPPELCLRNADGEPVAFDPNNADAREELRRIVTTMVAELDADGFKVDFTARTPTGRNLTGADGMWGIALLHELLKTFYDAAKAAKPDALVITHTPHPGFVDVTDMIRLNDVVGGVPLVEQMEFRAEVVRAVCPGVPIDTDDWRVPDKRSWRDYLAVKRSIGVPSLYYADHLDATGEAFDDDDYAALAEVFHHS